MTATRPSTLLALVAGFAVFGYLLAVLAYGPQLTLPLLAPLTMAVLAVVEVGMARVVRERLLHRLRPGARPLHPMQIARAAALAKASSTAGAVLLGAYAGLLAWTLPRRDELASLGRESTVGVVSVLASLALVAAALWLERCCRTPDVPDSLRT